jgi:hypothetical protein
MCFAKMSARRSSKERFPDLSLHDARELRGNAAKLVGAGIHPKAHERQRQQQTFAHHKNTLWPVCEEWLNDNLGNWIACYRGPARVSSHAT